MSVIGIGVYSVVSSSRLVILLIRSSVDGNVDLVGRIISVYLSSVAVQGTAAALRLASSFIIQMTRLISVMNSSVAFLIEANLSLFSQG